MSFDEQLFQQQIQYHATLAPIGFIILLPIGVLIPRFTRTFTNKWIFGHAGFQLIIAGPIILAGFILGIVATDSMVKIGATKHFNDPHKRIGLLLVILYIIQVCLGLFSHYVKRPAFRSLLHRTPHQILHIPLGLTIIGLAFYQVHLGYTSEWMTFVGTTPPTSVNSAWLGLVIVLPVLYVLGYALYPRQLAQESARRRGYDSASQSVLRKEEA